MKLCFIYFKCLHGFLVFDILYLDEKIDQPVEKRILKTKSLEARICDLNVPLNWVTNTLQTAIVKVSKR